MPSNSRMQAKRQTTKNRRKMQMKNKLKKTMTALCAALILMGGFSVPAYAPVSYTHLFMRLLERGNEKGKG